MDAGEVAVGQRDLGDVEAVTGDQVDDARAACPAASSSSIVSCAASCCVGDGFHTTVLPISAGAVGRLPAIAVKLNGVIA